MIKIDPLRERVNTLLARVALKGKAASFQIIEKAPGVVLLQHMQVLQCVTTDQLRDTRGRKFYLSPHMTDEEILQTALLAVILFEEHEVRERFTFDGKRIFSPHKSLAALEHCEEQERAFS
jgi:hypothetical protein